MSKRARQIVRQLYEQRQRRGHRPPDQPPVAEAGLERLSDEQFASLTQEGEAHLNESLRAAVWAAHPEDAALVGGDIHETSQNFQSAGKADVFMRAMGECYEDMLGLMALSLVASAHQQREEADNQA